VARGLALAGGLPVAGVTTFDALLESLPPAATAGRMVAIVMDSKRGDLFTQFGADHPAITADDILESSEAARAGMDYYSHSPDTGRLLERLAATAPTTLACMHGSTWKGDGAKLLRELADALTA